MQLLSCTQTQIRRKKLSNHLGNVLAVISDRKLAYSSNQTTVDYYLADVVSATDYFAFGSPMPARQFNSASYKYGFNGKENDSETKTQDYGMRIYNSRIAKFLSIDPLTREYPHAAPYSFAENGPIENIDRDGEERRHYTIEGFDKNGHVILKFSHEEEIREREFNWKMLKWEVKVNQRVEYVIHTGVIHEGAINGIIYHQEIIFHYNDPTEFVTKGKNLTQEDIDDRENAMFIADKLVAGLQNLAEEQSMGHIPYSGARFRTNRKYQSGQFYSEYSKLAIDKGYIPKGWNPKVSKKSGGVEFVDPKNNHNSIRIMPGKPNSPNKAQQNNYILFKKEGHFYDKNGYKLNSGASEDAHIPFEEFDLNKMPKFN